MALNHADIVQAVYAEQPAERTLAGALAFLLRLLPRLPPLERAGLLLKPAGENITPYNGQMVSAGRICYPSGQIFKVLTDVPTTNGPGWADDGTVDPSRYLAVQAKEPDKEPEKPVEPTDHVVIIQKLDALTALVQALTARPFPDYEIKGTIPQSFMLQQVGLKPGPFTVDIKKKP